MFLAFLKHPQILSWITPPHWTHVSPPPSVSPKWGEGQNLYCYPWKCKAILKANQQYWVVFNVVVRVVTIWRGLRGRYNSELQIKLQNLSYLKYYTLCLTIFEYWLTVFQILNKIRKCALVTKTKDMNEMFQTFCI